MLTISELFASVEGETSYVGTPMTFIRLTGCDLRCEWCDTTYAFHGGRQRALEDIVEESRGWKTSAVCITGGEPLLQPECPALVTALCERGFTVLVETSGSQSIEPLDPRSIAILDLKAPASGEVAANLWENLQRLRPRDEVKVVIADRHDYEWARDVVRDRGLVGTRTVFFNPAWGVLDPRDLASWILADGLGVRLGLQIHKYVWGGEIPGV